MDNTKNTQTMPEHQAVFTDICMHLNNCADCGGNCSPQNQLGCYQNLIIATKDGFSYKDNWLPFTDYCLLYNHAVCAGYAEAFQSMCITAGIECYYVTGYAKQNGKKSYHAWNRVVLDGISYYIDVCWNDNPEQNYFLSETLWEDHEKDAEYETYRISAKKFPIPDGYAADKKDQ